MIIAFRYAVARALRGIRTGALVQLSALGATSTALLLLGLAALGQENLERLTRQWGRGVHLTVYLQPDLPARDVDRLVALLARRPEVGAVQRVSPAEAYARLQQSLGRHADLLDGIEQDFLPPSLELRLDGRLGREALRPLLALLQAARGVDQVDYLGEWADRLGELAALLRRGMLAITAIVALTCLFIISSTIRLGVHARREEIEIQRLVGATDAFVRAPFLIEGALHGFVGGALAAAALYAIYRAVAPDVQRLLGSTLLHGSLSFLSPSQLALGIVAALLLGVIASGLAVGRSVPA